MAGLKWTQKEIDIVKENYEYLDKSEITKLLPSRSWESIKIRASSLDLKYHRDQKHEYVEADLSVLLLDELVSFYWAGFLAADGCFVKNRLSLVLAAKDKEHVKKFCDFVNCKNHRFFNEISYGVKIQDSFNVPLIKQKFDFKKRKTYNPPKDLSWMNQEFFWAFVIGYIDGDGSIFHTSNSLCLSINCHKSWIGVLDFIGNQFEPKIIPKINSGYAKLRTSKKSTLDFLYEKTQELPVLKRKWNIIKERNNYE